MARVLVTGGAGFIGSHLTEALLRRGDEVVVVDDESTGSAENLASCLGNPRLTYIRDSIGDAGLVKRVVSGVDQIYHLAAAVGVALIAREPIQTIERNIYPTQLLLDEARRRVSRGEAVKTFLASTSEVYGKNPKSTWTEEDDLVFGSTTRPRWSYGASKAIDEFLALACWRQSNVPVVVGRFFNVVGPRQSGAYGMVLPRFVESAFGREAPDRARRWSTAALLRPRLRCGGRGHAVDGYRSRGWASLQHWQRSARLDPGSRQKSHSAV